MLGRQHRRHHGRRRSGKPGVVLSCRRGGRAHDPGRPPGSRPYQPEPSAPALGGGRGGPGTKTRFSGLEAAPASTPRSSRRSTEEGHPREHRRGVRGGRCHPGLPGLVSRPATSSTSTPRHRRPVRPCRGGGHAWPGDHHHARADPLPAMPVPRRPTPEGSFPDPGGDRGGLRLPPGSRGGQAAHRGGRAIVRRSCWWAIFSTIAGRSSRCSPADHCPVCKK